MNRKKKIKIELKKEKIAKKNSTLLKRKTWLGNKKRDKIELIWKKDYKQ